MKKFRIVKDHRASLDKPFFVEWKRPCGWFWHADLGPHWWGNTPMRFASLFEAQSRVIELKRQEELFDKGKRIIE